MGVHQLILFMPHLKFYLLFHPNIMVNIKKQYIIVIIIIKVEIPSLQSDTISPLDPPKCSP